MVCELETETQDNSWIYNIFICETLFQKINQSL